MFYRKLVVCLLFALVAGCGGGSGSTTPASGSATAPPIAPPTPSMSVRSAAVARTSALGTSINIELIAQASNFTPAATLYASASDNLGVLQSPVKVSVNDGAYTFSVDTINTVPSGHYSGNLTLKLWRDQALTIPETIPSITTTYDLTVMARENAWPGDKITPLTAMSGAADWSTFQGNNAHTGYVPVDVKPDQIQLRWKRGAVNNSSTGYNTLMSSLVTSNNMFYASYGNKLSAYKEHDGSTVWNYDVSDLKYPSVNPPAVAGGVVYMAAGQQSSTYMFAFDAANGSIRFKSQMSSQWENYLAPVVQDSAVYTSAGTYGGMYGFNQTGDRLFFAGNLSQTSMWSPAVDARAVYAYTGDALTMYEPKSGLVLATIKDSKFQNYTYEVKGSAVIGTNGGVYAAPYANAFINGGGIGNALNRFDTIKGFLDWSVNGVYAVTPAYANGVLYAPNNNPYRVEARAEGDGSLTWYWTPPQSGETSFSSSPIVTKNMLFVSTNLNTYAIDLRSHKVVWSYPASGTLAISQNGILYIQNTDALVSINLK
ncbi:PQQ-binding-like beta-propeller repeat protein [Undibacterium sp.]|uniref:outer membrane protein assembly factor BamB family protein n=1 Tax=Undibacterium sp. TaxID=1914977 RepID=UPI0025D9CDAB|nr:PQQ-binding-like beta-propeller repeat protein [Undibacterium sp.]